MLLIAIQATETMCHQGTQTDSVSTTSTGVLCKILDDASDQESTSDSDDDTPVGSDHPDSPGYTPDSSGSSDDYPSTSHKTPRKAVKRQA